jgi:hypothetical protein
MKTIDNLKFTATCTCLFAFRLLARANGAQLGNLQADRIVFLGNAITKSLVLLIAAMAAGVATAADFPSHSEPRAITSGPKEHLFASYYAINAWSADGRYATVLETDVKGRLPTEEDVAVLGVVDTQDNDRFLPLTETRSWNFQEATMAH